MLGVEDTPCLLNLLRLWEMLQIAAGTLPCAEQWGQAGIGVQGPGAA